MLAGAGKAIAVDCRRRTGKGQPTVILGFRHPHKSRDELIVGTHVMAYCDL